jgi:hypothetical protein
MQSIENTLEKYKDVLQQIDFILFYIRSSMQIKSTYNESLKKIIYSPRDRQWKSIKKIVEISDKEIRENCSIAEQIQLTVESDFSRLKDLVLMDLKDFNLETEHFVLQNRDTLRKLNNTNPDILVAQLLEHSCNLRRMHLFKKNKEIIESAVQMHSRIIRKRMQEIAGIVDKYVNISKIQLAETDYILENPEENCMSEVDYIEKNDLKIKVDWNLFFAVKIKNGITSIWTDSLVICSNQFFHFLEIPLSKCDSLRNTNEILERIIDSKIVTFKNEEKAILNVRKNEIEILDKNSNFIMSFLKLKNIKIKFESKESKENFISIFENRNHRSTLLSDQNLPSNQENRADNPILYVENPWIEQ